VSSAAIVALSEGLHFGGYFTLAVTGLGIALLVAVAALSHQEERAFSAAVFYVGLGALAAVGIAVLGVDPLDPIRNHKLLEHLSELALTVAVFAAGMTVELKVRSRSVASIAVLLVIVMPASIALVAVFGQLVMGLSLGAAVLLGAVLAPTDPVLAGDVGLGPPGVGAEGEPRLSLHTEAGINDGLASPFVLLGLFIADRGGTSWLGEWILWDVIWACGVAMVIGVAAGVAAAWLVTRARSRRLMDTALDGFAAVGIVLVVYGLTELLGAYGLLALFFAGFAFRRYEYEHEVHEGVHAGVETAGTFLELTVLLLLGSMLTLTGLGVPGVSGWLLAPLLILVIRPVLVMTTSGRSLASFRERLFLAFFGVRGVAALFYAAIIAGSGALSAAETETVVWTAVAVVIFSIVVHGISSTPVTRALLRE
jgi:NhaP-type Na+/H+ or K+/H+ antiporter